MEWLLYIFVGILALIIIVCATILWLAIHVMIPLLLVGGLGYGLFFCATMAAGSPRSRRAIDDSGGERDDSGGLGE